MVRFERQVSIISSPGNRVERELVAHILHHKLQTRREFPVQRPRAADHRTGSTSPSHRASGDSSSAAAKARLRRACSRAESHSLGPEPLARTLSPCPDDARGPSFLPGWSPQWAGSLQPHSDRGSVPQAAAMNPRDLCNVRQGREDWSIHFIAPDGQTRIGPWLLPDTNDEVLAILRWGNPSDEEMAQHERGMRQWSVSSVALDLTARQLDASSNAVEIGHGTDMNCGK
jgi:hypothetical protein